MITSSESDSETNSDVTDMENAVSVARPTKRYHIPALIVRLDKLPLLPTEKEAILNRAKMGLDPDMCAPIITKETTREYAIYEASLPRQTTTDATDKPRTSKKQCPRGRSDIMELAKIKRDLKGIKPRILEAINTSCCVQATAKEHGH
ncbi:Kinesin [Trichuris trichiura]|uniref:Kinesin n=1 Tax=Trichuris trichiura TaxID=36087 RepID=A0A077YX95_TRITR|nr:Kinesin [Trichuris trichiura]